MLLNELRFLHSGLLRGTQIRELGHSVRWLSPEIAVVHMKWEMTKVPYRPGYCETGVCRGVFTHVIQRTAASWQAIASQNTGVVDVSSLLSGTAQPQA